MLPKATIAANPIHDSDMLVAMEKGGMFAIAGGMNQEASTDQKIAPGSDMPNAVIGRNGSSSRMRLIQSLIQAFQPIKRAVRLTSLQAFRRTPPRL
jgi:hypothetical protein